MSLKKSDFTYRYPNSAIAQEAKKSRQSSNLFIRNQSGKFSTTVFEKISEYLPEHCLIIRNNTKVFPSRLIGTTAHGGKVELFLLTQLNNPADPFSENTWNILAKPMKKIKVKATIDCGDGLIVTVLDKSPGGNEGPSPAKVLLNLSSKELEDWLNRNGVIPLPPYIKRDVSDLQKRSSDQDRYQTSYAKLPGSVAAPTAGLHFTEKIDRELESKGIEIAEITLHVGAGTFLPVKSENPQDHTMHKEMFYVSKPAFLAIEKARKQGRPIITVGTTSMRTMESLHKLSLEKSIPIEELTNQWHETDLFIYPKSDDDLYSPHFSTGMITNFHQPESTLFMLISALIGRKNAISFYEKSIDNGAGLFSYGDSSLLLFR